MNTQNLYVRYITSTKPIDLKMIKVEPGTWVSVYGTHGAEGYKIEGRDLQDVNRVFLRVSALAA